MLSTNPSTSSIQRRRQQHRRQQSLEVPILATPLPANPRRSDSTKAHRRGQSFDPSCFAINQAKGLRPLIPQNTHGLTTGPTPARTQGHDTQQAINLDQQHFIKQEPQEYSLAQPGFPAPPAPVHAFDFQSHLHQQLNGASYAGVNSTVDIEQAAAMQNLQSRLMWYEQKFGAAPSIPTAQATPFNQPTYSLSGNAVERMFTPQPQPQMPVMPATASVPQGVSRTVPNTPQQKSWPSPPPSHAKHVRSQSYQLDVAPMAVSQEAASFGPTQYSSFQGTSFNGGASGEQDYAASAYSSSVADPSSPPQQHSTPMAILFEEFSPDGNDHDMGEEALLLQATTGATELDFNDPNFVVGSGSMCSEQQALDAAGIDATYIDTGIGEDVLNSWLIHPLEKGEPFQCKFQGCSVKINRKENARSHVQNHLDDRRFQCNPCGKRFSRIHDTKRHFLTHTQERPAVCPCGKTFARADALTRHRQRDMCAGVLPGFQKPEEERPKRGRPSKKDKPQEAGEKGKKRSKRVDMDERSKKAKLARLFDRADAALGATTETHSSGASDHSLPATPPHDADTMDSADFLDLDGGSHQFTSATTSWLDTPPTSPPAPTPSKTARSQTYIDLSVEDSFHAISPAKLSNHSSPAISEAHLPSLQNDPNTPMNDGNDLLNEFTSPDVFKSHSDFYGGSSPLEANDDVFAFNLVESHPDVAAHKAFSPPGASESGSSSWHSDYDNVRPTDMKLSGSIAPSAIHRGQEATVARNAFGGFEDIFAASEPQYGDIHDMLDAWIAQQ